MTEPVFVDTNAVSRCCIVMNREAPARRSRKPDENKGNREFLRAFDYQEFAGNPHIHRQGLP